MPMGTGSCSCRCAGMERVGKAEAIEMGNPSPKLEGFCCAQEQARYSGTELMEMTKVSGDLKSVLVVLPLSGGEGT